MTSEEYRGRKMEIERNALRMLDEIHETMKYKKMVVIENMYEDIRRLREKYDNENVKK